MERANSLKAHSSARFQDIGRLIGKNNLAETEAAVETLSSALAEELRADGIRVTVLRSGSVAGGSGGESWSPEASQVFYAKIMETGHAQMAGEAASAHSMAEALVAVASLPADLCPRMFDVRVNVGVKLCKIPL